MNNELAMQNVQKFFLEHENLNRQFEEYIFEEIKNRKGLSGGHSNIGGWHSGRDLHAKLADGSKLSRLLLQLLDGFSSPLNEFINTADCFKNVKKSNNHEWDFTGVWFNVAINGSYNAPHTHPGSQISAAYYIRTEAPTNEHPFSGRIDFIQNNVEHGFFPEPGTLFLFSSDTLHWVHPYYGDKPRICLSFNVANVR